MIVKDLLKIEGTSLYTEMNLEKMNDKIEHMYACDLFSWVMGHLREENTVLLTVLSSINAVAVSVLLDIPAVIFCDGAKPSVDIINKANQEGICLFSSEYSSVYMALKINEEINNESIL